MRIIWLFGFVVALAGCVAPPAFTIATLAVDGFSYLATGKGVSDHVLSAARQQDCALWYAVKTQDLSSVCHDYDGTEGVTVVAAVSSPPGVNDSRYFTEGSYGSAAPALQPATFVAPPVSAVPALATVPANYSATYLVVGSFRRLDNAKRRVARMSDATLRMTDAVVDGKLFHRVVAGPFDGEDMAAARLRAVAAGVANSWSINLCTSDLAMPPCASPTVLAKGPVPMNLAANHATPAGPAN